MYSIRRAIPLPDRSRVLLGSWGNETDDRLENIVCVDVGGGERWRAKLPVDAAARDCFVMLRRDGSGIVARTFSGITVRLDPDTGTHIC